MSRKSFLKLFLLLLAGLTLPLKASKKIYRAPAFFVGHGTPVNAITDNEYTQSLKKLGQSIQRPKAILMISAHWMPPFYGVTVHQDRKLMYDIFDFPPALDEVQYPAPNAAFLTPKIKSIFKELKVKNRGLDHGAWSVLVHLFPDANIPVMQLGINRNLSLQEHFKVGESLKTLRDEGVMIIGSGNVTHNLPEMIKDRKAPILQSAASFDQFVKESIEKRDYQALIDFEKASPDAKVSHPTLEHYIPLLYVAAAAYEDDTSLFTYEGIEFATISMRNWFLTS